MKNRKLILTAVFMAFATLLAKLCGLVRDSMIAGYFSAGMETDAFMTATKLPTMLFDMVIGGVISASFIPVFNSVREKDGINTAEKFAGKFIMLVISVALVIACLGIVFSDQLVTLLAPGFSGDKHILTSELTAIMFPMIIFTGLAFCFVGLLQSYGEYNIPAIISLVSNVAIIAYFPLFADKYGIRGLAYTMLIAWSLQVIIQVPSLIKFKYKFRPSFKFNDANLKAALLLAGPMLISTWIQPLYSVINSRLASGIAGAPTILELANRLYVVMTGVFSFVVTNLIFPKVAKSNAENNDEEGKKLIVSSLKLMFYILLPMTVGVIILAKPITSIIYEHNKFSKESVEAVTTVLKCYSIGMVALAINEVLSKYFFSMHNSKTPMRNSILSMIINIFLAHILFNAFKTPGLALAAAGGSISNAVLNWISLKDKKLFCKSDWIVVLKSVVSTVVMAFLVYVLYIFISSPSAGMMGNVYSCIICGIVGVAIYLIMSYFLKIEFITGFLKGGKSKTNEK